MKKLDTKTILIIAIIAMVLLIMAVVIYFLTKPQTQKLSQAELIKDTNEQIYFSNLVKEQNAILYLGDQGVKFNKLSLETQKVTQIYPFDILSIKFVKFSPDGQKALVTVEEDQDMIYKVIDFTHQTVTILDSNIFDVKWFDNDKIIYSFQDNDKFTFNLADANGQNVQSLGESQINDPVIEISPDQQKMIVFPEPAGYGNNNLYLYDLKNKNFTQLPGEGFYVGAKWSPDSQKFMTNKYNSNGEIEAVVLIDINSLKTKEILKQTNLEKISWQDANNLIVAIIKANQNDQFVRVQLDKNKTTQFSNDFQSVSSNLTINALDLMLSPDSKTLYFTSNDWLYKLELK